MSLLPNTTHQNASTTFFEPQLPCGLASNLTWTASNSLYKATITNVSPQLSTTSLLSCTLQDASDTDGTNAWLVKATPNNTNGGSIVFYTAAQPATTASFKISWCVVKF